MKKIIISLICIFYIPVLTQAAIPLQQAIDNGLKLSFDLQNQYLEKTIIHNQKVYAQKNRLFGVDFGGSYLYQSEKMELQLPDTSPIPGVTIPGIQREIGTQHTFDFKVAAAQPLYTGGVLAKAVKNEELREAAQQSMIQLTENQCKGDIKSSFFSYLQVVQQKKSLNSLLENLTLHQQKIESLYKEQLARKSDLLETQKQIGETKIQIEGLNQVIESESIQFKKLCGYQPDEIDTGYVESILLYDDAKDYFLHHHPMLESLDHKIQQMNVQRQMIAGKYLPQVTGFAEGHYGKPGINMFADEWGFYFKGGFNVAFPVFHWNKRKQETAIPGLAVQKIKNDKADFTRDLNNSLRQLYVSIDILNKKMAHLEDLLMVAEEDVKIKEQLYNENQISHIDYLAALTVKEKYQSMKHELYFQIQLLKVSINTLIGYQG